jgi:tripartite ATP-independent transporter DctP family solute receptor
MEMKRLLSFLAVIGLLAWGVAPADAAEKIVLKVAQDSSTEHPFQKALEKFKEVLEAETGGAVEVQIFPNAQLGSEEQVVDGIKLNTVDATVVSAGNLAGFVPEVDLFNLPFIFKDREAFFRVLDGPIGDMVGRVIETKTNSVILGYWTFGTRNVWNGQRPVRTPDDLKGLKIRVIGSPVMLDTFNAFGAFFNDTATTEIYTAVQQGVIDGAESDPVDLLVEKFYEVTKYYSLTEHLIGAAPFIFSRKRYDSLPAHIQVAVLNAGAAAEAVEREVQQSFVDDAIVQLKESGIEFIPVDKDLFKAKVQPVYEKYADQVGGMELINQVSNY